MDSNRIKNLEHAVRCVEVDLYNAKSVYPYDPKEIERLERKLNNLLDRLDDAMADDS